MNRIQELIKELCPNGVVRRNFREVCSNFTGLTYKPEDVSNEGTLVLRSSNIQNSSLCFNDNVFVKMEKIPSRAIVKENDILVCVRNGSNALIGKCAIIDKRAEGMAFGAFMTIFRANENINYKFLFYIWQSDSINKLIHGDGGAPIKQITNALLDTIEIPLPPLPVQTEIVRILDKFVEQQEQLEKLIELRKKQYEYYREELLKPKEGEEWETKKLGEVCKISTGKGITKKEEVEGGEYPIISGGIEPMGYYDSYNRDANTVTISRVGANAGFVNYIKRKFYLNDKCFSVIPTNNICILYLYYSLKYKEKNITELQSEGGVPTINTQKLSSIEIPLPPLAIQEEIVRILDKLVEQQEQLEKLIELSKKRYEHYRDELLRF